MMKTARLKSRCVLAASASKPAFPESGPVLDFALFIYWRAKEMNVIRHNQITANEPRIGFFPGRNKRVMNIRVRKTPPPISGTDREEGNRRLPAKDENAFRWIPAPNIISDIRFDGVSPYQNSRALDRKTTQNAIPCFPNVNRRFGRATLRGAGSTESRPTGSAGSTPVSIQAGSYVPAIFPPQERILALVPAASASLMSPFRL